MKIKVSTTLILLIYSNSILSQKINEYSTFSKHFDNVLYIGGNNRSLDNEGIIKERNEYHPLTIAFYGIMAYEEFKKKKDSTNYQRMINQYKYFQNPSMIHIMNNGKEMGLPYNFNFHDLKAPWYSGMTQGAGISFVLRYYDATKDTTALTIAKQLASFLMKDIAKGGTIGKTPEGFMTIEEYPNSKTSPQVLNGFIIGLIGLYEYLQFFPNDTLARKIHDNSYEGMFAALEHYDTPTWTTYHRRNRSISNMYIRFQISELEHLYEIYKDIRLIDQMMIWGMMAYNKPDNSLKFYHHPTFQYSTILKDTIIDRVKAKVPDLKSKTVKKINYTTPNSSDTITVSKQTPLIINSTNYFNKVEFNRGNKINAKKISIQDIKKDKYVLAISDDVITITLKDTIINNLNISYKGSAKKSLKLNNINTYHHTKYESPIFAFTQHHEKFEFKENEIYKVYCETHNTPNLTIFYRTAPDINSIKQAKWIHYNKIESGKFVKNHSGVVQFMISYELNDKKSIFYDLKFERKN